jgi:uncharacterized membrane protein YjjP (DUF1212 family)
MEVEMTPSSHPEHTPTTEAKREKESEQKEVLKSLLDLFLEAHPTVDSGVDIESGSPVFTMEHIEQIESFLMQLSTCYQSYGCPTHTIEVTMGKVAKGLGVEAHFIVFPSHTIFELATVKTEQGAYRKRTQFFRTSSGYDFYKLQLVDELARRISAYAMDMDPRTIQTTDGVGESAINEAFERGRALSDALAQQGAVALTEPSPGMCPLTMPVPTYGSIAEDRDIEAGKRSPHSPSRGGASAPGPNMAVSPGRILEMAPKTPTPAAGEFHLLLPGLRKRVTQKRQDSQTQSHRMHKLARTILDLARLGPNVYNVEPTGGSPRGGQSYRAVFSKLAVEDGVALIRAIMKKKPLYSDWFKSFLLGVASFGCAGLFFGGGWNDMWISFLLGVMVARIETISQYRPSFSRVFEFTATFIASIIIRAINQYWMRLCYRAVLMSTIVWSLQGVTITMAFIDLMTKDLVSGTTRLFYDMLVSAMIGFAMDLSTSTYAALARRSYTDVVNDGSCDASRLIDHNWYPLLLVITTLAFNILIEAHVKQLLQMEIICVCCYVVYYFTAEQLNSELPTMLAAFTAACVANLYCRFTGHPPVVYIIPAIFLLVPGSVAASSFYNVFTADLSGGLDLAFSVVTGALAIAIGLFGASAVVQVPDVEEFFHKVNALYPGPKSAHVMARRKSHRNSALTI